MTEPCHVLPFPQETTLATYERRRFQREVSRPLQARHFLALASLLYKLSSYSLPAVVLLYCCTAQVINEMPLYPTEGVLWDENQIPSVNYSGETCLALPKLNLQFLTAHDYLLRNFNLFRCGAGKIDAIRGRKRCYDHVGIRGRTRCYDHVGIRGRKRCYDHVGIRYPSWSAWTI